MGDMADEGGGGEGEMGDVLDPSMMEGGQGGGDGAAFSGIIGSGPNRAKLATLKVQSLLALQELGIVIGVAFLVAAIFMLMISLEKLCTNFLGLYHKRYGKAPDEEDPAALVGTFKRYKN